MVKVLVVGQTPPPFGGQTISTQVMLDGIYQKLKLFHVRMSFSNEMDEIGKFRIKKLWHLLAVIVFIVYYRFRHDPLIFYYIPAGPQRIPMYRDMAILLMVRWLFKRTVFHFHAAGIGELYDRLSCLERIFFRKAYFGADLGIMASELNPPDAIILKAKKTIIFPTNGMADWYSKFGKVNKKNNFYPIILYVGVLCESKGILILLDACRRLKDSGLPFKAKFMGKFASKEFRKQVEDFIEVNGLQKFIEFLGVCTGTTKWEAYSQADILAFPSFFESESLGRVILEAMNFAIPVVATRWRGIPSMVEDGKSGFLVSIKDSQALADKIAILLKNPKLGRDMGKRGREIYLERFTAEKFWRNMEEAFLSVA